MSLYLNHHKCLGLQISKRGIKTLLHNDGPEELTASFILAKANRISELVLVLSSADK